MFSVYFFIIKFVYFYTKELLSGSHPSCFRFYRSFFSVIHCRQFVKIYISLFFCYYVKLSFFYSKHRYLSIVSYLQHSNVHLFLSMIFCHLPETKEKDKLEQEHVHK